MEKDKLIHALNNEKNNNLISYTFEKINDEILSILSDINIQNNNLQSFSKKLNGYRYIDEINLLDEGRYIRWINLNNTDNLTLNAGAILCKITFQDDGIHFLCKTFKNKCFTVKFEENLIFMKLNDSETVLLNVLSHLDT